MNLCLDCPIMNKLPCPILNYAYHNHGLEGMEKCEINQAVTDLIKEVREDRMK